MGLLLIPRLFGFIFRPISMLMRGDFRGLFSLLFGFAMLGALWLSALFGISQPSTATGIMTEAGVAIVNPILERASLGLASGAGYDALQTAAKAAPAQPVTIPGLKVTVLGSDICPTPNTCKSFDDATRVIYGKVATAYYDGGASAVFNVPPQVGQAVNVALEPAGWLTWTSWIGLTPDTLTAQGHADAQTRALWLWGASALLGLLVLLLNKGWTRLYALAHGLFTGAVPGLVVIGAAWLAASRIPDVFGSFTPLFDRIGQAIVPVYVGAGIAALALVVAGLIGGAATKGAKVAGSVARRTPAPAGVRSQQPRTAYPSYDTPPAYRSGGNAGGSQGAYSSRGGAADSPPAYGRNPAYGQSPGYGQSSGYGQGSTYNQGGSYGSAGATGWGRDPNEGWPAQNPEAMWPESSAPQQNDYAPPGGAQMYPDTPPYRG